MAEGGVGARITERKIRWQQQQKTLSRSRRPTKRDQLAPLSFTRRVPGSLTAAGSSFPAQNNRGPVQDATGKKPTQSVTVRSGTAEPTCAR